MAKTKIDDLSVLISADASGFGGGLRQPIVDLNNFKKQAERITADIGGVKSGAKQAAAHKRAAKEAGSAWRDVAKPALGGGASLGGKGASAASSLAKDALVGFVSGGTAAVGMFALEKSVAGLTEGFTFLKDAIKSAGDQEQTQISFEVMLGGVDQAKATMADLREFAAKTPFAGGEVTESAKNLLAYGTAADQIIPTLKVLGNITAPIKDTTSLKDMVYLFGTLQTQGRAYAQDIRQFTGRGIPIIDALAKEMGVAKDEVMHFVEEGRIGFPQVARALESLQLPGGKFAGMMDKQAESLNGLFEQAGDAFDQLKTSFGQMVVESADLKGIVKDVEAFAKSLKSGIDTKWLRDGIKFASDLGRGIAHVGLEIGKAGLNSGGIFGEMASQLPQFKETFAALEGIVSGMKEFKIDPEMIAGFAINFSKEALMVGAGIVEAGKAFKENVIDPIAAILKDLRDTKDFLKGGGGGGGAKGVGNFLGEWAGGVKRDADVALGRPVPPPGAPPAPPQDGFDKFRDGILKASKNLDAFGDVIKDRLAAQKEAERSAKESADRAARLRELEASITGIKAFRAGELGAIQGLNPLNPLMGLAGGMPGAQREIGFRDAINTAGPDWLKRMVSPDRGRLNVGTDDPHINEVAKRIKNDFDPMLKLNRDLADFRKALDAGKISAQEYAFARDKEVRAVADAAGIGGPTKLPDAAMRDSAESVRILNQWQSGNQTDTVESLLRQLVELQKQRNTRASDFERTAGQIGVAMLPR